MGLFLLSKFQYQRKLLKVLSKEIKLKGKKPSNLAFGGNDGKTIYVTLQDRGYIESFRVENAGRTFNQSLLGSLNYIVTSATSASPTYE